MWSGYLCGSPGWYACTFSIYYHAGLCPPHLPQCYLQQGPSKPPKTKPEVPCKVSYRPSLCSWPCPNTNSGWTCRILSSDSWEGSWTTMPTRQWKQNRVHLYNIEPSWPTNTPSQLQPELLRVVKPQGVPYLQIAPSPTFIMNDIKVYMRLDLSVYGAFGCIWHLRVVHTGKKMYYCSNFCYNSKDDEKWFLARQLQSPKQSIKSLCQIIEHWRHPRSGTHKVKRDLKLKSLRASTSISIVKTVRLAHSTGIWNANTVRCNYVYWDMLKWNSIKTTDYCLHIS